VGGIVSRLSRRRFLATALLAPTLADIGGRTARASGAVDAAPWRWPHGRAAISLSYDDGTAEHLEQALPDLEAAGLRGTFYLSLKYPAGDAVERRQADWRAAFERGHEIGNHTVHHPCRGPEWDPFDLTRYDAERIEAEVAEGAAWLDGHIGPDPERSFAYPCSETEIGPADRSDPDRLGRYAGAVARRHRTARLADGRPTDPLTVELTRIPARGVGWGAAIRLADLQTYCDMAVAYGRWAVLVFHSFGEGRNQLQRADHRALLAYLTRYPDDFWVAPVRDVAQYIRRERGR
jgi:peptidoglycan-N-acetylglucosamine deacetylase